MRSELLDRLHSAFDRSPDAAVALAITHAQGVAWSVARHRLVVSTEDGSALADLSLLDKTISQLASALTSAGVTVSYINPAMSALHAAVLLDGGGVESESNGSLLRGHRSVLHALVDAYAVELEDLGDRVPRALEQAQLHSAVGDWLDFWGGYFGVSRAAGQDDAAYLQSIIAETLRPKSNRYAIERAILDITGKRVEIDEPWTRIFRLDASALSSGARLKDGATIGRNLIRPIAREPMILDEALAIVGRMRAAGVQVLPPAFRLASKVDAGLALTVRAAVTRDHNREVHRKVGAVLGEGAIEDAPILNHPALYRRENRWLSYVDAVMSPVIGWRNVRSYRVYFSGWRYPSAPWPSVTWSDAGQTWSSYTLVIGHKHTRT